MLLWETGEEVGAAARRIHVCAAIEDPPAVEIYDGELALFRSCIDCFFVSLPPSLSLSRNAGHRVRRQIHVLFFSISYFAPLPFQSAFLQIPRPERKKKKKTPPPCPSCRPLPAAGSLENLRHVGLELGERDLHLRGEHVPEPPERAPLAVHELVLLAHQLDKLARVDVRIAAVLDVLDDLPRQGGGGGDVGGGDVEALELVDELFAARGGGGGTSARDGSRKSGDATWWTR